MISKDLLESLKKNHNKQKLWNFLPILMLLIIIEGYIVMSLGLTLYLALPLLILYPQIATIKLDRKTFDVLENRIGEIDHIETRKTKSKYKIKIFLKSNPKKYTKIKLKLPIETGKELIEKMRIELEGIRFENK